MKTNETLYKQSLYKSLQIGVSLAALVLFTGCLTPKNTNSKDQNSQTSPFQATGSPLTPTPQVTPSPTPSSVVSGSNPTISVRVDGLGYTGDIYYNNKNNKNAMTISAGKVLKIKFTPGTPDQSGFQYFTGLNPYSASYSKLGVFITVGGQTLQTYLLSNGQTGGSAQSQILDFSGALTACASSSNTACRQNITIKISKPNYDYWCLNYGYCQTQNTYVWDTHTWNAQLEIQTDDTQVLQ